MNNRAIHLPWTDSMVVTLLNLVIVKGAHVAVGKKSTEKWSEVYNCFFADEEVAPYKALHFKVDEKTGKVNPRKIRDKFDTTLVKVTKDIESGNQSGKEGDLNEIYRLVKQISDDINEFEETKNDTKEKHAADKAQLNNVESLVLNGTKKRANENSSIRVKHADGSITVDGAREQKAKKKRESNSFSWESQMGELVKIEKAKLAMAQTIPSNVQLPVVSPHAIVAYDVEELQISSYIAQYNITAERFLLEAYQGTKEDPPASVSESVRKMGGLHVLVSVYCSRGFDFDKMQKELEMMGFQYMDARILHSHLQVIRRAAVAWMPPAGTPAGNGLREELLSTSSASFLTSSSSDYGEPSNYTLLDDMVDATPRSN